MKSVKRFLLFVFFAVLIVAVLNSCQKERKADMTIQETEFGTTPEGQSVQLYTLANANGMRVSITNYGGIITEILVPDKNGDLGDVALGYDSLEAYLADSPYFGSLIGRYGNRIAGGRFSIDGMSYTLAKNDGPNHLHGGIKGFDKRVWTAEPILAENSVGLKLVYLSPDGEEGYPGNLTATVVYTLTRENEIVIDYAAESDQTTICNLTNHTYFNLKDAGKSSILDHVVRIHADRFTPIDETFIPTGELRPVADTPFDFLTPQTIGSRIDGDDPQLENGLGYDHNFVLNGDWGKLRMVAQVSESTSGRVLSVYTTEPGLQFYSGNFLDGSLVGKDGAVYEHRHGFCMETQHFPDSPNKPLFPSTVLEPGTIRLSKTVYKFSVL
ncbi:galactose mutarotase [candidate division KSB1 bacterium]|nr:galactose mutarotase [candidate division KSB1 bacterium]